MKSEEIRYIQKLHAFFNQFTCVNPKIKYHIIQGSRNIIVLYFSIDILVTEIVAMRDNILEAFETVFKKKLFLYKKSPNVIAENNKYNYVYWVYFENDDMQTCNPLSPKEEKELMMTVQIEK